jgi:hypothetical protein
MLKDSNQDEENNKEKPNIPADQNKANKKSYDTESSLGIGLCLGICYGIIFHQLALGISLGLCLGLAFGAFKKKDKDH